MKVISQSEIRKLFSQRKTISAFQTVIDFLILHQRGFTLSDSAYLSGDIKCERANELSAEIDLLLRQLLSEAEDEIPIAELVTSLINNKANVTEENEKEDKTNPQVS